MKWCKHDKEDLSSIDEPSHNKEERNLYLRLLTMLDFTSLNPMDTPERIRSLCDEAQTIHPHVAAICVYPQFVPLVTSCLHESSIRIATVANFADGNHPISQVKQEIMIALAEGAQEIDVVFPYQAFLKGDVNFTQDFLAVCREICPNSITLKVILETGALQEAEQIAKASRLALIAGANFIKTSTGKIAVGASLPAAAVMLAVIAELKPNLPHPIGLKISGGIRSIAQASSYLQLAELIMGKEWPSPMTFRIGASQLLTDLLAKIKFL